MAMDETIMLEVLKAITRVETKLDMAAAEDAAEDAKEGEQEGESPSTTSDYMDTFCTEYFAGGMIP